MFSLKGGMVSRRFCSLSNCSLAVLFVAFVLLRIVGQMLGRGAWEMVARNCSGMILIALIWLGVNKFVAWRGERFSKPLPRGLKMTFFVYCTHYPIVVFIHSEAERFWGDSWILDSVGFWTISLLLPAALVAAGVFLDRRWPKVMCLLNGGR